MTYRVQVDNEAADFFQRSSAALQRRLDRCFDTLAGNPRSHPNIKPLKGEFAGCWRYRLGDYRIIYRVDDDRQIIFVMDIAHRRDVYE